MDRTNFTPPASPDHQDLGKAMPLNSNDGTLHEPEYRLVRAGGFNPEWGNGLVYHWTGWRKVPIIDSTKSESTAGGLKSLYPKAIQHKADGVFERALKWLTSWQ